MAKSHHVDRREREEYESFLRAATGVKKPPPKPPKPPPAPVKTPAPPPKAAPTPSGLSRSQEG